MAEEFTVIPLKFEENDVHCHQILVKENIAKGSSKQKPVGRTLYALNIPPYATKESLRQAFSAGGEVENVILQDKPSVNETTPVTTPLPGNLFQFKIAYIVFQDKNSVKKVLKKRMVNPLNANKTLLTGIDKWTKAYQERIPDPVAMQVEIDRYMKAYDKQVAAAKSQNHQKQESGWTTVSKKNSGVFSQKQSVVKKLEKKLDNDRNTKELKNFYTFQIRESKKNDIISLRKKYDRDLKKMERIKKTKRFKPY
ncbi:ribosomal RNA-processing protein 7 homolog A [Anopheles cruzii]|uniref:ribosomal RNA-processing protein 7 homolog A n=1 Tax=Anopheles cruzii TaxID=68878 RepID=UPI0022EC4B92|nr:ribosomal RNA-processing protein 7 homolog A [Anopheles cruzii]